MGVENCPDNAKPAEDEKSEKRKETKQKLRDSYKKYCDQKKKFLTLENVKTNELTEFYETLMQTQKDFNLYNGEKEIIDEDEKQKQDDVGDLFSALGMMVGGIQKGLDKAQNNDDNNCIII